MRRHASIPAGAACLAIVLAAAACARQDAPPAAATPAPAPTAAVVSAATWDAIDGFESDPLWTLESAGDHGEVACAPGTVSEGRTALLISARAGARGKVTARKEVDLDASGLTALRVDACVASGPAPRLVLGLRTADGGWFETAAVQLVPGWNRAVSFPLEAFSTGDAAAWAKGRAKVDRLMVIVVPQGGDCAVAVDDLRGSGTWRWRSDPAELLGIVPPPAEAKRFAPLQLGFAVAWAPELRAAPAPEAGLPERMLRRQVAGGAWITAPDGERWFQGAACTGTAVVDGRPLSTYAVRFSPDRAGPWTIEPGLDAGGGRWVRGPQSAVAVAAAAANPGPVRLAAGGAWLERGDGSFLWPLGTNVAWAGDYAPWLERMGKDGCTAVRVWLCPWSNPLDVDGDLEAVNQVSAAAIDRLLDDALARGLTVQLCLTYHGWFGGDWGKNPFNKANGGPCADGREFWTDWKAQAGFRRVLDYAAARWGHHPALLAWELVNEADFAPRFRDEDVIEWHRAMARHLAKADRRRHLITTSVGDPANLPGLWRLGDLDLVQVHRYERDPLHALALCADAVAASGKAGWAAEIGRDWLPRGDQADPEGRCLRRALWLSWMHGLGGSSWAWWWDLQVQPQQLTRHHAALARFLAGEDPRGLALRSVSAHGDGLDAVALLAVDRGWAWAGDAEGADPTAPAAPAGRARGLHLAGLAPGAWTIERWDPIAGALAETRPARVLDDGLIELIVPPGESAFKLRRAAPLVPAAFLPGSAGGPPAAKP